MTIEAQSLHPQTKTERDFYAAMTTSFGEPPSSMKSKSSAPLIVSVPDGFTLDQIAQINWVALNLERPVIV